MEALIRGILRKNILSYGEWPPRHFFLAAAAISSAKLAESAHVLLSDTSAGADFVSQCRTVLLTGCELLIVGVAMGTHWLVTIRWSLGSGIGWILLILHDLGWRDGGDLLITPGVVGIFRASSCQKKDQEGVRDFFHRSINIRHLELSQYQKVPLKKRDANWPQWPHRGPFATGFNFPLCGTYQYFADPGCLWARRRSRPGLEAREFSILKKSFWSYRVLIFCRKVRPIQ